MITDDEPSFSGQRQPRPIPLLGVRPAPPSAITQNAPGADRSREDAGRSRGGCMPGKTANVSFFFFQSFCSFCLSYIPSLHLSSRRTKYGEMGAFSFLSFFLIPSIPPFLFPFIHSFISFPLIFSFCILYLSHLLSLPVSLSSSISLSVSLFLYLCLSFFLSLCLLESSLNLHRALPGSQL